ncbi:hypothetical protein ACKKBF_B35040 [Auxenochlorella protothecoides x Auxenochlorella symbiontica]
MGCIESKAVQEQAEEVEMIKQPAASAVPEEILGFNVARLASKTHFTAQEVASLHRLFLILSNELHEDNLIHKDEFLWALFKARRDSLFADRVFELFDIKQNQVLDFEEFVCSLSVFHPDTPLEEKASFAFRIYDIGHTGAIERSELKRFLIAVMADNPEVDFDESVLEAIVDATFAELDIARDGRINPEEWGALVSRTPDIISYMTLPVLRELTTRYPVVQSSPPKSRA